MFCHMKNKIKNFETLQIQRPFYKKSGRTFLSTSKKGGLTVEAALVTPFCTFIFAMLLYILLFMVSYVRIQCSVYHLAASICQNAYMLQAKEKIENDMIKNLSKEEKQLWDRLKGGLENGWVKNEILSDCDINQGRENILWNTISGLKVEKAEYEAQDGNGQIQLRYEIQLPFLPVSAGQFTIRQKVCFRGWVGKSLKEGEAKGENLVYVAKYATVYHTNRSCTYLSPSIEKYKVSGDKEQYTVNGKTYAPCRYCMLAAYEQKGYIWIARYGDCYHKNSQCSAIARTVFVKDKTALQGMKECQKCAASRNQ